MERLVMVASSNLSEEAKRSFLVDLKASYLAAHFDSMNALRIMELPTWVATFQSE